MDATKYIGNSTEINSHYAKWKIVTDPKERQLRGYELEKLIYSVLINEKLNPKINIAPDGEQIDGSFLQNHYFLIEAKWHAAPIEASKIYAFKGKVDGKFHLTSGIFISMSGYSEDAPIALKVGKTSNLLLFDEQDMDYVFTDKYKFTQILDFKIEMASLIGETYMPFKSKVTEDSKNTIKQVALSNTPVAKTGKSILIVSPVQKMISPFVNNILQKLQISKSLRFQEMTMLSNVRSAAAVKNIHRSIIMTPGINEYSGVILLYPINDETYKYENSELTDLNSMLSNAGVKNGATVVITDEKGSLDDNLIGMLNNWLIWSSK
ncbi:MAG: restriction endonuclease [Bacteroidia bacterium]